MGLGNPCYIGTPLNLQPKGQYSLDRLMISTRSLLNTKEEEKEMNLSDLSLQHLVGKKEKKHITRSHIVLGSNPASVITAITALGHNFHNGFWGS